MPQNNLRLTISDAGGSELFIEGIASSPSHYATKKLNLKSNQALPKSKPRGSPEKEIMLMEDSNRIDTNEEEVTMSVISFNAKRESKINLISG